MQGFVMSDKSNDHVSWDARLMIENAKSLQRVAKELRKKGAKLRNRTYGFSKVNFWRFQFCCRSRQRSH